MQSRRARLWAQPTGLGEVAQFSQRKHSLLGSKDPAATADDPLLNTELSSLSQCPHSIQEVKTSPLDLHFIQVPTLSTPWSSLHTFQGLVSWEVPN